MGFAPGCSLTPDADPVALREDAVREATDADVAVLFLGLAVAQEAEGADRPDIELPTGQVDLLRAVGTAQPATVAVLSQGGVLRLAPVADLAPAIVEAALLGQAGGGAVADVLFGVANPSGRLAETVPVRLQDAPSYLNYPDVTFPFGHGLSYTTFGYTDLRVSAAPDGIAASVTVTNTGQVAGREVVQFYVSTNGKVLRPPRELKAWGTIALQAGESGRSKWPSPARIPPTGRPVPTPGPSRAAPTRSPQLPPVSPS